MPEIIARYRRDFPDLPVELSVGNSLDVINAVADLRIVCVCVCVSFSVCCIYR